METEKRIGDFRVNRKVSWGITFPQNLHTGLLIRIAQFCRLCAGFVHSLGVEFCPLSSQPPDAFRESCDRVGILVAKPAIGVGPRRARVRREVRLDGYLFDIA